jgi:hypothetical protein
MRNVFITLDSVFSSENVSFEEIKGRHKNHVTVFYFVWICIVEHSKQGWLDVVRRESLRVDGIG